MLTQAIQYREILTYLYNSRINDPTTMITDAHWSLAILVHKILVVYDHATKIFCYAYQLNVHLVILECIRIVHAVTNNMNVDVLKDVPQDMMENGDHTLKIFLLFMVLLVLLIQLLG